MTEIAYKSFDDFIQWNWGHEPEGWQEDFDNDGQIVYYTGLYSWSDGTIRREPENSGT